MALMHSSLRSWFDAWRDSAYGSGGFGSGGFWSHNLPGEHFRTSAATGGSLARLVSGLLERLPEVKAVIDVGAGGAELLVDLAIRRPDLQLTGIDLRPRSDGLPPEVGWATDYWDVRRDGWARGPAQELMAGIDNPTLVLANEWLDDLPCRVAAYGTGGWRELLVDSDGRERPGSLLAGEELGWVEQWWPNADRAEVGLTRDRAWAHLVAAVRPVGGSALLVDYGHRSGQRPEAGSLIGFQRGRRVCAIPQPDRNLSASVAIDAVRAAGEAAGARTRLCRPQAEVVAELWPATDPTDPTDPLAELVERSHRTAMTSPRGWGAHWWLWQS